MLCGDSGRPVRHGRVSGVAPPLPNRFEVRWSDTRCDPKSPICSVRIAAYRPKTMTALVLNFDNFTFYEVSATAELEAGY